MKKIFLSLCLIGLVGVINGQENSEEQSKDLATYGVKYNPTTKKNEIYRAKDDGTETFLIDFRFPTNGWTPGLSFSDPKTGKLYLWASSAGNVCDLDDEGNESNCRPITDDEKGYVVYDPATNTIEQGVKKGYIDGYQKTFQSVLVMDDLIKNATNGTGNDISVIGSNELVDDDSTVLIANSTDTDGDAITVIGSNEVVGANGNTLISEEENGEIHIGENSLVTVEKDGVQLLYATDANGDQIDINIKKGTDLLVDGKSVTQALKDIDTNKTNIAKNADDIATNKTNIAKNADDIATNKTNIAKNADDIATNKTNIATNATNISTNATNIATNKSNIETNALGIANNSLRIDNLAALVNSNVNRIEGLETLTGLMRNEYRTGIASSIALSQIQYASDGFSIGVGHGEFKDKDEMAVGIGYGGQFNEKVGYQFQFGSSGDSTGFGFTIRF